MFTLVSHAERFSQRIYAYPASYDWPWWLHHLVSFVAIVKSVHERAQIKDVPVPARYKWFDDDALKEYFDKEKKKKR